jgi:hypothetical protein
MLKASRSQGERARHKTPAPKVTAMINQEKTSHDIA